MKNTLGKIIGVIVLFLILWASVKMIYLKYYGKETEGLVQSVYKSGSKGHFSCRYTYTVKGQSYEESAAYGDLNIGDTIVVLYLSFYPQISVPQKMVLEYW